MGREHRRESATAQARQRVHDEQVCLGRAHAARRRHLLRGLLQLRQGARERTRVRERKAPDSSAWYSRERETAIWMIAAAIGATSHARSRKSGFPPSSSPPPKNSANWAMNEIEVPMPAAIEEIKMSRFATWRELVGEHAAELALVEDLQDAFRDRDLRVARVAAGREGVGLQHVRHDRSRASACLGLRELTDDAVELRVLLLGHGSDRVVCTAIDPENQYIAKLNPRPNDQRDDSPLLAEASCRSAGTGPSGRRSVPTSSRG